MASWQPKKLDLTKINSGARFNNGDGVNADDINAVVESSAFVQSLGENQPQLVEDGGKTSVSIDTTNNKFIFKNIKGEQGIQGIQGERGEGVPTVTISDNGKFLRVVNGQWTAVFVENAEDISV
jgi:hypothetical protein